jgi:hypothetical protein
MPLMMQPQHLDGLGMWKGFTRTYVVTSTDSVYTRTATLWERTSGEYPGLSPSSAVYWDDRGVSRVLSSLSIDSSFVPCKAELPIPQGDLRIK